MGSTIPAARTALYAGLDALRATTLTGVSVNRTGRWDQRSEFDVINVLNARQISREWPAHQASFFTEEYTIPVEVRAFGEGDDVSVTESRLWALVTIVEAFVMSGTQDLGVAGVQMAHPIGIASPGEESGPADNDVLLSQATVEVRVNAIVEFP